MNKKILLISYNYYPEPTGIGKYNGEQMRWLANQGYECTVITTYPYYPHWKVQVPYNKHAFIYTKETKTFKSGGKINIYRCPIYVPEKPSGIKRILLDISFLISAGLRMLLLPEKKFDVVLTVAPSFLIGLLGTWYKSFKSAKLLYHVQDLQIEAARDLQMIKSKKIIDGLFRIEKYIFNKSDIISTISDGMVNKIKNKANKDIFLLPNWTDTKQFYPIENKESLKTSFGFKATDRIILYSGAIGEKQGLEAIVQAAKRFEIHNDWKFVICGSGPYKIKLQSLVKALNLHNVIFLPLQPFEKFNTFLNIADVHLVIQKANASDLVMPSKLTTILAIGGVTLITANKGSGLYSLVKKHKIGILVEAENQKALNDSIYDTLFYGNKEEVALNARNYAERHLGIDSIMKSLENKIFEPRLDLYKKPASN